MQPERGASPDDRVIRLLETFFQQSRRALLSDSQKPDARQRAMAFLSAHGFDTRRIDELPIGLFTDGPSVRQGLEEAGLSPQEIEASALVTDQRLAGRLIGPIRDPRGEILSFWARHPNDRPPRLLFKGPWKEAAALVGLEAAFQAAGSRRDRVEELVVVERLFDALLLQSHGFPNAAAIAGPAKDMTARRWERLAAMGVRRVTLMPDREEAFGEDFLRAVENADRAKPGPEVFVVPPESWHNHLGAADFLRARGVSPFRVVLQKNRVHAFSYKALAILWRHRPGTGWTEASQHAAWKAAIEVYATAAHDRTPDLDAHFVPTVVAELRRSWDTFEPIDRQTATTTAAATPAPSHLDRQNDVAKPPVQALSQTPEPDTVQQPPEPKAAEANGSSRTGLNGYCRHHGCDPSVCFCFD
jgi:DNA primase